jgi:hypothetical protein
MRTWTIGLLGLLAACAACTSPAAREGEAAVRRYNEVAIAAYRANDPSRLREVATAREARKVFALVDLKKASEVVLESTLLRLSVKGIERISDERMTVETEERWRYHDRPLQPGVPPGSELLADMHVRYDVFREDGAWKVSGVAVPWNQYYDPVTEQPIPRPDFEPVRGKGLTHAAPSPAAPAPAVGGPVPGP